MSSRPHNAQAAGAAPAGLVTVGTWNVSYWHEDRLSAVGSLSVDILALQETKLARIPLERARGAARGHGYTLHHGPPVPATRAGLHGDACGVGLLAAPGVAVSPLPPQGPAWRRLHDSYRLHGVCIPPRSGLPRGLRLFTVYAPLRRDVATHHAFSTDLLDLLFSLDLQVPTLLLGDFNGTVEPAADYSRGSDVPVCPLLARLLGPGAPLVDLQLAISPAARYWTFRGTGRDGQPYHSRIDLILGNRAAMPLVVSVAVRPDVMEGGHSPVLAVLRLDAPLALDWRAPRPRLPALLQLHARELHSSNAWLDLLERWEGTPEARRLLDLSDPAPADALSAAIEAALQALVQEAGGWLRSGPCPRRAYDSEAVRRARASLAALGTAAMLLHQEQEPGPSSTRLLAALRSLRDRRFEAPDTNRVDLLAWVEARIPEQRRRLRTLVDQMRLERRQRWRGALVTQWSSRPRALYRWLAADSPAWGASPILNSMGMQCKTHEEVDRAVQDYWVNTVWHQHAGVDEGTSWAAFRASPFCPHLPVLEWPQPVWTAERVQAAIQAMREDAAPGPRGIPLSVWRCLPLAFLGKVAALLAAVEANGAWPAEQLQAYVTLIPKAAGGSRPQDQRPITVLDTIYRIWAKGTVQAWTPVLQNRYLGPTTLGFRAQAGTLHLAQLLSDIMTYQRRQQQPLWLASFDIARAYPSLPWWAVFGVLEHVGVPMATVRAFRAFYTGLRSRFRNGQVDGAAWGVANGIAQGCPASPDLLNIMFEGFHRWAAAEGLGVNVRGHRVGSASFADDVTLIAASCRELGHLIEAFLEWSRLLGLTVNVAKTQVWCSLGAGQPIEVAGVPLVTRPTFRVVGIELGGPPGETARAHAEPRLAKAYRTADRLRALPVPAAVAAHLWRAAVLAQALYGCEVCSFPAKRLVMLARRGGAVLAAKEPLLLSHFRAPEIVAGMPLGACALADPQAEQCTRRVRWLTVLANEPSLVGTIHRALCCPRGDTWTECSPPLATALRELGWQVEPNPRALLAVQWPALSPEPQYTGTVRLAPHPAPPPHDAVYTDGSVQARGGAAAVQMHPHTELRVTVPQPRSPLHCEFTALKLVHQLPTAPSLILTDSLTALQLIQRWGSLPVAAVLGCEERAAVRSFVLQWASCPCPPILEKVKAHDDAAAAAGQRKAVGNSTADAVARAAAAATTDTPPVSPDPRFEDAVRFRDHHGDYIRRPRQAAAQRRWDLQRGAAQRRGWFTQIYPPHLAIDWDASALAFGMPTTQGTEFVHRARPAALKWLARARAGALNTGARCVGKLTLTAQCAGCPEAYEDDAHAVAGCPGTGAADWLAQFAQCWARVGRDQGVVLPALSEAWLREHRLPLAVALIPLDIVDHLRALPCNKVKAVAVAFHLSLVERLAEVLRRREELSLQRRTAAAAQAGQEPARAARPFPAWGTPERQLPVAELCRLQREPPPPQAIAPPQPPHPRNPREQEARRAASQGLAAWVRDHPHLERCAPDLGEPSIALLLLWEADHDLPYPSGASELRGRVTTFTKRLLEASEADDSLHGWLKSASLLRSLAPCVTAQRQRFWGVRVRPGSHPRFQAAWFEHLRELVRQNFRCNPAPTGPGTPPPAKRPRKELSAAQKKRPVPPVHTREERVKRLRAAQTSSAPAPAVPASSSASCSTSPPAPLDPAPTPNGPSSSPHRTPAGSGRAMSGSGT